MRILFLEGNPYRKDTYGDFYFTAPRTVNYGLLCLAAMLENKGFRDIAFFDLGCEIKDKRSVIEKIKKFNPDVVGVTIFTIGRNKLLQLLREIKNALPKAVLIAGGPHVTIYPHDLIRQQIADYCMIGESDYSFPEFVDSLNSGKKVSDIPNLVFQNGNNISVNPARELIDNLDKLPFPAFHLIGENLKKYHPQLMVYKKKPVVNLITSRGCPYSCKFCSNHALWGKTWRANSAEYVVNLIQYLIERFKIREVIFYESSFAVNKQRVLSICKLLIKRGIKICWTAEVNLRNIDEELAYYMKKSGCWLLSCGIESGDDSILRSINKPITIKEVEEKVNLLTKMGLKIRGYFMLGHIEDTHKTLQATVDLSQKLPFYTVNYTILVPEAGSELFTSIYRKKTAEPICGISPYSAEMELACFGPQNIPPHEIVYMQRKAFLQFFLRRRQIFKLIKDIRSFEDIKRYSLMFFGAIILITRRLMRKGRLQK